MKKYLIILLALPFIACEKVIDFEGEVTDPMIVLGPSNAVSSGFGLSPFEDSVQIILSNSLSILDNGDPGPIVDAQVQIRETGGSWHTLGERANGYYSTNEIALEAGKTYRVKASADGYDDVSAECSIPHPLTITNFVFDESSTPQDSFSVEEAYDLYNLTLSDPGKGANFFCITVKFTSDDSTVVDPNYNLQLTSKSPYTDPITDGDYYYMLEELFGSNEGFEGSEVTIPLQIFTGGWSSTEGYTMEVTVKTLDEAGGLYHTSRQRYQMFGGSGDPFSQPVQVYTNVEGGLGFLGGYMTESMLAQ